MNLSRSPLRLALWALLGLSALLTLLLLIVTLALPGWVSGRGAALAAEALGRPVSIGHAQFQPWRLALVLDDVQVAGAAPDRPALLTLAKLDVALSLRSLARGRLIIESLALTRPELRLARTADGHYDIDDILQRFASKPAGSGNDGGEPPEFAVYNIELDQGRLLFDDRPVQRQHELAALHLALPFVSTLAADVEVKVLPRLRGRLDGVAFDSRAEALPFQDDASGRLTLKLAGLDMAPLAAYLPASLPLRLNAGRLDADLALDFAELPQQAPSVKLSGTLQMHELALAQPDGQPLLTLQQLSLPLLGVQPLQRELAFGQIQLQSPRLWWRPQPAGSGGGDGGSATPWRVSLAGAEVKDGRLALREVELEAIELKLGAAAWPLKSAAQLDASLRLGEGSLSAQAKLSPEALQAQAELRDLAVERLASWLPLPGGAQLASRLSGRAELRVKQPLADAAVDRTQLTLREVQLRDGRLSLSAAPVLALAEAALDQAEIDLAGRQVRLGILKLEAPRAQLARADDGRWNIDALLPAAAASAPAAAGPAWKFQWAGLQLARGALRWRDAAVPAGVPSVALAVEPLRVELGAAAWPAAAAVPTQITAQVAALGADDRPIAATSGSLQWQGRLGLAPLSAKGSLQAQALPLRLLDAYLDPAWGLHLQRAELGVKADIDATRRPSGAWQATLSGDMRVGPLALMQARVVEGQRVVGEDLLSWQRLQLDGLNVALAPDVPLRVAVRDAALDDAYARLIVNEQGRFNLRDVGPAQAASAPASAPAPAGAASAPVFAVERLRVSRGTVDFNDRFVKPNYSARLTELQGSLGAFSSGGTAMAPLTLRGKVAGTGLLAIDGQLKPGAPLAMDVQANASDIELAPLSGYAARYAGYAIERGKLSARLRYKVEPGGQLEASNQIILNQLTFGDAVESADATSLPVRFAAALLKDRDGVIDVNLPISGSLNDPEFSVGGLIGKLLLNLIGKALTSPFSLFTGSDAAQEAQVIFVPGSADLAPTDRLDHIARQLADKPGVQLTLTGWADAETEVAAIREKRLDAALQAETAATPDAALKRLYEASKLPNKPRNLLGLAKDLPPAQMRGMLMGSYEVGDEALRQLAVARAVAVRDALLARGAPSARVFLGAPKLCDGACEGNWRPHVELSLGAH
ncbi:DUF748 domain-containing protein [Roseateles sp. BYS96W]|uniref:DUF748 domain-containing protein n=1 Tax=Pelomonas nitida TaxID=3299027 RepID=A0ABW7G1M3_9BURK